MMTPDRFAAKLIFLVLNIEFVSKFIEITFKNDN